MPARTDRPNVLFIIMDDMTHRAIGCLNNPEVQTPHIDSLVRRGTTFTHAFHHGALNGAVCVPARAMVTSGLTLHHLREQYDHVPLWSQWFGEHGYHTFLTGKWHNGEAAMRRAFQQADDFSLCGMLNTTPRNYLRSNSNTDWSENQHLHRYIPQFAMQIEDRPYDPADRTLGGHWMEHNGKIIHSSERWANAAVDYLHSRTSKNDQPFFMHVAFHAPHDPRQCPQAWLDRYPINEIDLPPNYLPEHPFDQGDHLLRDEVLAPFPRTQEAVRLHRREYYAILSHADEQIGRILKALDEAGHRENTLVIFTSDHGLAVGQHGLMGKQNQYDHSIRVPLIVAGPGIRQDHRIDAMVHHNSLYPTTCQLANLPIPGHVETPSLTPLLQGEADRIHEAIYGAYLKFQRMVRTENHKLIVYPHIGRWQLFDVANDPWEINDLAADRAYAGLIRELHAKLAELQRQLDDPLDLPDPA